MGLKIKFDSTHNVIAPTLILATRNGTRIGNLPATNIVVKDCFNAASELSFSVHKSDCVIDGLEDENIKLTPISLTATITSTSGYVQVGSIQAEGYNELVQYSKSADELLKPYVRFTSNLTNYKFDNAVLEKDSNREIVYVKSESNFILLKIEHSGNVFINNAGSIGLTNNSECTIDFSFRVPLALYRQNFWEKITDFKLIWARDWGMWFEAYVSYDDSTDAVKNITAKSLGEAELSQINLYEIEINTEADIAREDYVPTCLYDKKNRKGSLLHRITEKIPHYTIAHVDETIQGIQRTFSFNNISIYEAFKQISKEINCLFEYVCRSTTDGKIAREINVYDLESNCKDCGKRGEFTGVCPSCGSANITEGVGEDTAVFISTENLANTITYSTDNGSVKNCFKLEAGDDLMTATVRNCNPNGSSYIWYVSDEAKRDMSDELVERINAYEKLEEYYQNEYELIPGASERTAYNNLVTKYRIYSPELTPMAAKYTGFPSIMEAYYNVIDFYYLLKDNLMPTMIPEETSAETEATKLNYVNLSPVALQKITNSTSVETVSNAVLALARVTVNRSYRVNIVKNSESFGLNSALNKYQWKGFFTVSNYSDETDVHTTEEITVDINDDVETYIKQKIRRTLANARDEESPDIVDLIEMSDTTAFAKELKKYSLTRLQAFYIACQSCVNVLIEQGVADKEKWTDKPKDLYTILYRPYVAKSALIYDEIRLRSSEIKTINGAVDEQGNVIENGARLLLETAQDNIQKELDFERFLGSDLWLDFAAYRREDTYKNTNFISDGLNNSELFKRAIEFMDVAKKDIYKSATLQHSISATLKNLLVLKEFEPITDKFEVGNWLRIRVGDDLFKLRLVDYEIKFDNLDDLPITFSDVSIIEDGITDVESVLNQATSLASSYDAVTRQMDQGRKTTEQVKDWVENGLSLTKMKIVDSAENQDVVYDRHGILCREYLPYTDTYSDQQLKIINKGLYVTDDGWETARAGIGNFQFFNPLANNGNGAWQEGYGVIADTLVGNLILGNTVAIYNDDTTLKIDKDGFTYDGEYVKADVDEHGVTINENTMSVFDIDTDPVSPTAIEGAFAVFSRFLSLARKLFPNADSTAFDKIGFKIVNDRSGKTAVMTCDTLAFLKGDGGEGSEYSSFGLYGLKTPIVRAETVMTDSIVSETTHYGALEENDVFTLGPGVNGSTPADSHLGYPLHGEISNDGKYIRVGVPVDRSISLLSDGDFTLQEFIFTVKGVNGYVGFATSDAANPTIEFPNNTNNYRLTWNSSKSYMQIQLFKMSDNLLEMVVYNPYGFAQATNNTPVSVFCLSLKIGMSI